MSDFKFPLIVTLKSDDGKVFQKGEINSANDRCSFEPIPPGRYTVSGLFADGINRTDELRERFYQKTAITYSLDSSRQALSRPSNSRTSYQPSQSPRRKLPVKAIIGFSMAATFAGHFGGAAPLLKEALRGVPNSQPAQSPSAQHSPISKGYEKIFPGSVAERLRTCVKNNARYLSGIPTLSSFLKSKRWEREAEDEFEQQLIFLYADYEQIRIAINRCNPVLAYEVLFARSQVMGAEESMVEFPSEKDYLLNVRESPNDRSRVIAQLSYGTPVLIDRSTMSSLSEEHKQSINQRVGWLPIVLADERVGYIYNRYTSSAL